jgi:hypothetical protein
MEQFVSSGIMQQDNSEQVILDPKLIAKAGTTVHYEQSKKLFVLGLFIFNISSGVLLTKPITGKLSCICFFLKL